MTSRLSEPPLAAGNHAVEPRSPAARVEHDDRCDHRELVSQTASWHGRKRRIPPCVAAIVPAEELRVILKVEEVAVGEVAGPPCIIPNPMLRPMWLLLRSTIQLLLLLPLLLARSSPQNCGLLRSAKESSGGEPFCRRWRQGTNMDKTRLLLLPVSLLVTAQGNAGNS